MSMYVVIFTFCFFLMFLGILRIFEVNEYFGIPQYDYVEQYCEPRGFFGWGYDCDTIQYNIDIGIYPIDYRKIPLTNFTIAYNKSYATGE